MNATDLRVLCTLATMARGVDLEMPSVDQMPRDAVESDNAPPRPDEMFLRGNVRLSRRFLVETPHDGQKGQCEEQSQVVHFVREIPDLLLRIELYDIEDSLKGALVALADRDLIASHGMELALPVGTYTFRTSGRKLYQLAVRMLEKNVGVGRFAITVWSEAEGVLTETVSMMRWYSVRPKGWELSDSEARRQAPAVYPCGPAEPAWERLEVIKQRSGNDLAKLNGREHRLPSKAAEFLVALKEAKGQMVLADTLTRTCGKRADHIFKSLPDDLKAIIDAPGRTGQGYRMK